MKHEKWMKPDRKIFIRENMSLSRTGICAWECKILYIVENIRTKKVCGVQCEVKSDFGIMKGLRKSKYGRYFDFHKAYTCTRSRMQHYAEIGRNLKDVQTEFQKVVTQAGEQWKKERDKIDRI